MGEGRLIASLILSYLIEHATRKHVTDLNWILADASSTAGRHRRDSFWHEIEYSSIGA